MVSCTFLPHFTDKKLTVSVRLKVRSLQAVLYMVVKRQFLKPLSRIEPRLFSVKPVCLGIGSKLKGVVRLKLCRLYLRGKNPSLLFSRKMGRLECHCEC